MAKQISAPDPVSAAMSAIESALNLTDDDNLATHDSPPRAAPISAPRPAFVTPVLKPAAPSAEAAPLLRPSSTPLASVASETESNRRFPRRRRPTTTARRWAPSSRP